MNKFVLFFLLDKELMNGSISSNYVAQTSCIETRRCSSLQRSHISFFVFGIIFFLS